MKPAYIEIADLLHEREKERAAAEAADVAALERPTKHVSRETMERLGGEYRAARDRALRMLVYVIAGMAVLYGALAVWVAG